MNEHTITSADRNVEIAARPAGSEPADVTARRIAERDARARILRAGRESVAQCRATTTSAPHRAHAERGCPLTPEAASLRGLML